MTLASLMDRKPRFDRRRPLGHSKFINIVAFASGPKKKRARAVRSNNRITEYQVQEGKCDSKKSGSKRYGV